MVGRKSLENLIWTVQTPSTLSAFHDPRYDSSSTLKERKRIEETTRELSSMVREERRSAGRVYICGRCGFAYEEREWAEKCEAYCTEHNACSLEITSHAVKDT